MSWSAPLAFWFAVSLLVILVLHGIKLFRRRQPTSTLFIWRQIARESQTSLRLERVIQNLPLLLQLLLAALLVLALAQPLFMQEVAFDKDMVLVVDASGSMNSRVGAETRFDRARAQATELINGLGDGQKMALVSMGRAPRLVQSFTDDQAMLSEALAAMTPTQAAGELKPALLFALSLAKDLEMRQVVMIGDGAYPQDDATAEILNGRVTFLPVEGGSDNVAITRFAYRPYLPPLAGGEALVTIANFSSAPRELPVTLEVAGQQLLARTVSLAPGAEEAFVVRLPPEVRGAARVSLQGEDDFGADNEAFGVISSAERARILVVGKAGAPLRAALGALSRADVRYRKTWNGTESNGEAGANAGTGANADPGAAAGYDLIIFNGVAPPELERGTVVVIGALSPQGGLTAGEMKENPRVTGWEQEHSLLRFLDPRQLKIKRAPALRAAAGTTSLIESEHGPLLALRESGGLRVVTLAFDLADSRMTANETFPLFIANLVQWAHPESGWEPERQVKAGESYLWRPSAPGARRVTGPDGTVWEYPAEAEAIRFEETGQVGIYTFQSNGTKEEVAVNLLDAGESRIGRNANYIGRPPGQDDTRGTGEISLDGWPWLVLVGAIFLLVEWVIWNRYS